MAYVEIENVIAGAAPDIATYNQIVENQRTLHALAGSQTVTLYTANKLLRGNPNGDGSLNTYTLTAGHVLIGGTAGVVSSLAPGTDGQVLVSRNGAVGWETP